jgi:hypothetical protein
MPRPKRINTALPFIAEVNRRVQGCASSVGCAAHTCRPTAFLERLVVHGPSRLVWVGCSFEAAGERGRFYRAIHAAAFAQRSGYYGNVKVGVAPDG